MSANNGRVPSVFISSTCYDLSQVRNNLKQFIEQQLGFEPILSEYNSFPVESDLGAIDNCIRVVEERADLFILIVGGKYGYITGSGKSVTNLEYIRARTKGIPIFVFVAKSVLSSIKIWKDNPGGDFSSIVDSTKLFEFVETLNNIDNVWIYGFDNSMDIIDTLRTVSYRAGHAQTSTTQNIYAHAIRTVDEMASEALDDILTPKGNSNIKKLG